MDNTKYQITKTVRFGLTKVRKEKKHLSHEVLDELVIYSENKIKQQLQQNKAFNEQIFVNDVRKCGDMIKEYLLSWGRVCKRVDKIIVRKEFFKILSRKTFFIYKSKIENKGNNKKKNKKTPLPSEIKLSGQKNDNIYGDPINEGISQYWQNNVLKALKLHSQFEIMLQDYETALKIEKQNQQGQNDDNKQFDKPHLVDFRKLFLAVCSLVMDSLRPIVNDLIIISDNISKDEDKFILDFVNDKSEQYDLFSSIEKLQNIIRDSGGNVYFGKATLNKYTSEQVPNHRAENIDDVIKKLKLKEFVSKYIGLTEEEICKNIRTSTQKSLDNLNKRDISPIIRAQYFKYKTIPALVRHNLAKYLSQQQEKKYSNKFEEIIELFRIFGTSHSPALDYSKLQDKASFTLEKYPIKVAFDFAWEQCARAEYSKNVDFPKEICKNFLQTYFKYNTNEYNKKAFDIYAHLLKANECLATLEHFENEPPKDSEPIYQDAIKHLKKADTENRYLSAIEKWYTQYTGFGSDYKKLKQWIKSNNHIVSDFTNAKMHLGQKRGSQKSLVLKSYKYYSSDETKNVTDVFFDVASYFGKNFASIRDYFSEENEVNKINYGAVIIQDNKGDKYLLLQEKNEGGNEMPIFKTTSIDGDFDVYQVQSLTYKSANKIYESSKYPNFFNINGRNYIKATKRPLKFFSDQEKANFLKKKLDSLKRCLTESDFIKQCEENTLGNATKSYLDKFNWSKEINECTDLDQLAKVVDQKGYYLKSAKISKEQIEDLVKKHNCLLLPIVNQNITAENKNDKNQFTKDWNNIFDDSKKDYRIHPEFTIYYRHPTPDYPCPDEKRYSRFQMNVNFLMEVIPSNGEYISRKEQIAAFNNPKKMDEEGNIVGNNQEKCVEDFNNIINENKPSYIIGIDRGINELATLCVMDSNGKIVGIDENGAIKDEFDIFVKHFDKDNKCWIHNIKPKTDNKSRAILDLSNLRVETTIDGKQVLVDLSSDEKGESVNTKQIVHLKHLYYLRCLSYRLQSSDYKSVVLDNLKDCNKMTDDEIREVFNKVKFIDAYKGGKQYTDLPYKEIRKLISDYNEIENSNKTKEEKERELNRLCQLDAAEALKKGVVANMIGIVVYILKKLNYDARISLENLCRAFGFSKDALSGYTIASTNVDPKLDFKDQENAKLAGVGTYSFFEIQLLKKLFKLQIEDNKLLVPAFRSVENYEKMFLLKNVENKIYQFGIVYFVDPANTSLCCPICGSSGKNNVDRKKHIEKYDEDELVCECCGFHSNLAHIKPEDRKVIEDPFIKSYYDSHNLRAIISGDANAGYNIALRLCKNIYKTLKIKDLHQNGKKYKKANASNSK